MKKLLFTLLAMSALVGGIFLQRGLNPVPEGLPEMDIAFPDLNGKPHNLTEWKGKVLIVNFWATWCPPCLEEMPEFVKLQNEFGAKGLQFIGILTDDEAEEAREFLKSKPLNYPVLDGTVGGRQWTDKLGDTAGVLPISVVFDPQGKRVHTEIGIFTRDEVLEKVKPWIK
jgi:thiol-disulfide isomerase/thioredoxin